jgi:hypothetical protein
MTLLQQCVRENATSLSDGTLLAIIQRHDIKSGMVPGAMSEAAQQRLNGWH